MQSQNLRELVEVELNKRPWLSGDIILPYSQLSIHLPPEVRIMYEGLDLINQGYLAFENTDSFFEFKIEYPFNPNTPEQLFIAGHEEGHLCRATGNLLQLYREMSSLGFNFYFLTKKDARKSDAYAIAQLNKEPKKIRDFYDPNLNLDDEKIADVVGLIALIKENYDNKLIQAIAKKMKSKSRKLPKIKRLLDKHFMRTLDEKMKNYRIYSQSP